MSTIIAGFLAGWISYTFSYQYMSPKRRAWYTDNIVSVWMDIVFGVAPMLFIGASFGSIAFAVGTSIGLSATMFIYAWFNRHYPSEEARKYRGQTYRH